MPAVAVIKGDKVRVVAGSDTTVDTGFGTSDDILTAITTDEHEYDSPVVKDTAMIHEAFEGEDC
jgi:hypothetical protein